MLYKLDPTGAKSRAGCELLALLLKAYQAQDVFSRRETFKVGDITVVPGQNRKAGITGFLGAKQKN